MQNTLPHPTPPQASLEIARAANAFLPTLAPEQRDRAALDFWSDERHVWNYTPVPRNGLSRGDMDEAQLAAAEALMASSLSPAGLAKARAIIQHELLLRGIERSAGSARFARDPGKYFFSVFGRPGAKEPWGWRVDGHHLCLNVTADGRDIVSVTPSFFGANPAEVKHGPHKGLRVLREEEDLGRELFLSLEPGLRQSAVIYPVAPPDLITRTSRRVEITEPAGLPAARMPADQRQLLMSLVRVYVGRVASELSNAILKRIEAEGVGNIFFAWAGSAHRGQGHYYRLHGPSFFAEYDNTQNMANHVHAVWRDVRNDFGVDVLRAHYDHHHT